MHVFVDTNVILDFFSFTKEDLDSLNTVFATHEHGSATVYMTEQVRDEFHRNRESKIEDAMKRFRDTSRSLQLPSFMRQYPEFKKIQRLSRKITKRTKSVLERANQDIQSENLQADKLICDILNGHHVFPTTDEVFVQADRRMSVGNPPGKRQSLGDTINWIILLNEVPADENIHVVSGDGDYFSKRDDQAPHPFLKREWRERNGGELRVYRTLSAFLKENFDGVAFSFDKVKQELIGRLRTSPSFAGTHNLIAELEAYGYFTLDEVTDILSAAQENTQFGWILTDDDVAAFLVRVALPRKTELETDLVELLDEALAEEELS